MNAIPSKLACRLIDYYQRKGGGSILLNTDCNFEPTCSEYAKQAISGVGLLAAWPIIISRLKRCKDPDKVRRDYDPFIKDSHV